MGNYEGKYLIADRLGLECQLQQLTEECAELIQAINKHWRSEGKGMPLRKEVKRYDVEQNLIEELADVKLVIDQVIFLMAVDEEVDEVITKKVARTVDLIAAEEIAKEGW